MSMERNQFLRSEFAGVAGFLLLSTAIRALFPVQIASQIEVAFNQNAWNVSKALEGAPGGLVETIRGVHSALGLRLLPHAIVVGVFQAIFNLPAAGSWPALVGSLVTGAGIFLFLRRFVNPKAAWIGLLLWCFLPIDVAWASRVIPLSWVAALVMGWAFLAARGSLEYKPIWLLSSFGPLALIALYLPGTAAMLAVLSTLLIICSGRRSALLVALGLFLLAATLVTLMPRAAERFVASWQMIRSSPESIVLLPLIALSISVHSRFRGDSQQFLLLWFAAALAGTILPESILEGSEVVDSGISTLIVFISAIPLVASGLVPDEESSSEPLNYFSILAVGIALYLLSLIGTRNNLLYPILSSSYDYYYWSNPAGIFSFSKIWQGIAIVLILLQPLANLVSRNARKLLLLGLLVAIGWSNLASLYQNTFHSALELTGLRSALATLHARGHTGQLLTLGGGLLRQAMLVQAEEDYLNVFEMDILRGDLHQLSSDSYVLVSEDEWSSVPQHWVLLDVFGEKGTKRVLLYRVYEDLARLADKPEQLNSRLCSSYLSLLKERSLEGQIAYQIIPNQDCPFAIKQEIFSHIDVRLNRAYDYSVFGESMLIHADLASGGVYLYQITLSSAGRVRPLYWQLGGQEFFLMENTYTTDSTLSVLLAIPNTANAGTPGMFVPVLSTEIGPESRVNITSFRLVEIQVGQED